MSRFFSNCSKKRPDMIGTAVHGQTLRRSLSSISGTDKDANDSTHSHVILHAEIPKGDLKWYAVTIRAKGLSYIGPLGWSNHEVTAWVMMALMHIMTQKTDYQRHCCNEA